MAGIFVDAGAWIALLVDEDAHNQRAAVFFRGLERSAGLVTSNYVIAETVTWLVYHGHRRAVPRFRDRVEAAEAIGWLRLIWATRELDELAWRVHEQFDDQRLSFTDCSSVAICRDEGIDRAFSFDRHFPIAGIEQVPRI